MLAWAAGKLQFNGGTLGKHSTKHLNQEEARPSILSFRCICLAFQVGYTPIHIAAKYGHVDLINKFAEGHVNLRQLSRKTGIELMMIQGDTSV